MPKPACLGADRVLKRADLALAASLTPALSRREREQQAVSLRYMRSSCIDAERAGARAVVKLDVPDRRAIHSARKG